MSCARTHHVLISIKHASHRLTNPDNKIHAQSTSCKRYTNFTFIIYTCSPIKQPTSCHSEKYLLTHLAAATATTLERKQFRVSFPPNPPPEDKDKKNVIGDCLSSQVLNLLSTNQTHVMQQIATLLSKCCIILADRVEIITLQDLLEGVTEGPNLCDKLCPTM